MATCGGQNNPLSHLGKVASNDRSIQRDRVISQNGPRDLRASYSLPAEDYNRSFEQLATAPTQFNQQAPIHQAPQRAPVHLTPQTDWSAEFSRLSLDQSRHGPQQNQIPNAYQRPLAPTMGYSHPQPTMAPASLAYIHPRMVNKPPTSIPQAPQFDPVAFDRAFASAENQANKIDTGVSDKDTDLSEIAHEVITTVSSNQVDSGMSSKLKQSKFLSLMEKLRSREVTATEKDFVDASGEVFDPLAGHGNQTEGVSPDLDTKPPGVGNGSQGGNIDPYASSSSARVSPAFEQPKDVNFGMISAFEEANKLGPISIPASSWEEDYEDSVWIPPEGR